MFSIKGFITNLGKYNEGELVGEWIEFPIEEDDLEAVLESIGIGEEYEEYFFTDWDCDADLGFGEYENIETINCIAEDLQDIDEDLVKAAIEAGESIDTIINGFDNFRLYTGVDDDYDLGYYYVRESGCYDLDRMGTLADYIDYEAFGHDVRMEDGGSHTSYGYFVNP